MLIGHYALAMAAKAAAPKTSLGTLIAASAFLDLVWPIFVSRGLERVIIDSSATAFTPLHFTYYPFSHSLLMSVLWGAFFGLLYYRIRRYARGAVVLALVVVSHWFLDAVVHPPDLQLTPWNPYRIGFALWNNVPATLILELAMLAGGAWIYTRRTQAKDSIGHWGFFAFLALAPVVYAAAAFGPPPPNIDTLVWGASAQLLFVALAAWVDSRRRARVAVQTAAQP